MDSPLNHHTNRFSKPACLDISAERLDSMSPSELEQAMEDALSIMAEDNYDPAVIDAYLDALDRKAPMPKYPDAKKSYSAFQKRVQSLSKNTAQQIPLRHNRVQLRGTMRISLVAVIIIVCLLCGMAAVQAAGIDVFEAIARWSESAFSFGDLPSDTSENPVLRAEENGNFSIPDIPEEYQELQKELEKRGLPLCYPKIPLGFKPEEPFMEIDPETNRVSFSIIYTEESDYIGFNVTQYFGEIESVYEKDASAVKQYEYNGITHYIFNNNDCTTATWVNGYLEYALFVDSPTVDIMELIQSFYEV